MKQEGLGVKYKSMDQQFFYQLLDGYLLENIAAEEEKELFALLEQPAYQQLLSEHIGMHLSNNEYQESEDPLRRERIKARLNSLFENDTAPIRSVNWWRRIAVAASIFFAVGMGSYFLFYNNKSGKESKIVKTEPGKDVKAPETNRAMITLADGSTVYLDSTNNGQFAAQGNVKLIKNADGQIVYQPIANSQGVATAYNTLINPKGSRVIDMILADGSHVWLNAGSSVTYPVAFTGKERKVSITGEAYFEVAHNKAKPFIVSKGEMNVEVLGTKFNVNAYEDEADIKVTLLEGSVKTSMTNAEPSILKPGEQAQVSNRIKIVKAVDVEQVMAWKNGYFKFNRTDLKIIMREISRWYDVEVSYEGNVPVQLYNGDVPRNVNVSEVLKVLEYTGAHFKIEGKKVTVMK